MDLDRSGTVALAVLCVCTLALLSGYSWSQVSLGDHKLRCVSVSANDGATTTCICQSQPDDRLFHDTDCDQTKDAGENWLDFGTEVNELESEQPPNVQNTEIFIGTAAGAGAWSAISGDATMSNAGVLSLEPNSVESNNIVDGDIVVADLNSTLAFNDGDDIDLSAILTTGTAEGLKLPVESAGNDCAPATAEAQICWDSTDDNLYIGDGSTAQLMNGLQNIVEDLTPQLGADLDVNGFGLDDSNGNELVTFAETASAENHIQIANAADSASPVVSAVGDDASIGLFLQPKGSGAVGFLDGLDDTKRFLFNLGYLATSTDSQIIPQGQGNLFTPDLSGGSDQVVARNTTDTLTNKTIDANNNTLLNISFDLVDDLTPQLGGDLDMNGFGLVQNNLEFLNASDPTKRMLISLGYCATGTDTFILGNSTSTRIMNLPDANGTFVFKDTTDTLTNKTLGSNTTVSANIDMQQNPLGDGTLAILDFVEDGSAVNYFEMENEASGSGPILRSTGPADDIDLVLDTKGDGVVTSDASLNFSSTDASQSVDVAVFDHSPTWTIATDNQSSVIEVSKTITSNLADTTIFADAFTGSGDLTAHTPDTGTQWTLLLDTSSPTRKAVLSANKADPDNNQNSAGLLYTADATYSSADYQVEVRARFPNGGDNWVVLAARIQDSNDFYHVDYSCRSGGEGGEAKIFKTVAGSITQLGDTFPGPNGGTSASGTGDLVKFRLVGSELTLLYNDVVIGQVDDGTHTGAGSAGLGWGNIGGDATGDLTNISYADDFAVTLMDKYDSDATLYALSDATETSGSVLDISPVAKVEELFASSQADTFQVVNNGLGNSFRVNDDGTLSDATPFIVSAEGNVGVQTPRAPEYPLTVVADGDNEGLYISDGFDLKGVGGNDLEISRYNFENPQLMVRAGTWSRGVTISADSDSGIVLGMPLGSDLVLGTGEAVSTHVEAMRIDDNDGEITFNLDGDATLDMTYEGDTDPNLLTCDASEESIGVGVALAAHEAKLHVYQNDASGAVPVLVLEQDDIDDSFVDFQGTSAADGTRSISSDTTEDSTKFGAIRIEINGVTKWIRIYDNES
jgi:hypothetical protein